MSQSHRRITIKNINTLIIPQHASSARILDRISHYLISAIINNPTDTTHLYIFLAVTTTFSSNKYFYKFRRINLNRIFSSTSFCPLPDFSQLLNQSIKTIFRPHLLYLPNIRLCHQRLFLCSCLPQSKHKGFRCS